MITLNPEDAGRRYTEAMRPYWDALKKLKLPTLGEPNDPRNLRRVFAVAEALHAVKVKRAQQMRARKTRQRATHRRKQAG